MHQLLTFLLLVWPPRALADQATISAEIPRLDLMKRHGVSTANVGFAVFDPLSQTWPEIHNERVSFVPASVSKVPTALMVLETLGADFKFETKLGIRGKIKDGTLKGDLYLYGSGDPNLTFSDLYALSEHLVKRGIQKLDGRFFYDDSLYPKVPMLDPYGESDKKYNPGLSALSSDFNRFTMWKLGRNSSTKNADFLAIPPADWIRLNKSNGRFDPGVRFSSEVTDDAEIWSLNMRNRYNRLEELPVREPSRYTASVFSYFASLRGIILPPAESGNYDSASTTIHTHQSRPLIDLVKNALEYSNNVLTELLLLRAARTYKKTALDLPGSGLALEEFLKAKVKLGEGDAVAFANGSGITSQNKMSPQAATKILAWGVDQLYAGTSFGSLLNIFGWSGRFYHSRQDPKTAFKVWAKTGTLDYASGITGFLFTEKKRRLIYSIFMTDFENRNALDAATPNEALKLRRRSGRWSSRAIGLQDDLIKAWIAEL